MQFRSLESLRGIAAIMVVLFHSAFVVSDQWVLIQNSGLFVDFFFVLSGFVMSFAYRDRVIAGLGFSEFAILRAGRLFPLHVVVLMLWVPLILWRLQSGFGGDAYALRHGGESFLTNLFLLNSFGLHPFLSWNYPSWSIGAEMVAYLAFFVVVTTLRRRLSLWVALGLSAAAYLVLVANGDATLQRHFDLGVLRCVGGFFLGVALFGLHEKLPPDLVLGSGVELAAIAAAVFLLTRAPGSMAIEGVTILSFALVVMVFTRSSGVVSKLLQHNVPAFLGRISYSVYLVHALVLTLLFELAQHTGGVEQVVKNAPDGQKLLLLTPYAPVINLAALGLVVAISLLTYRCVEEPFRKASRRLAKRAAIPVFAG